ncbi:hypothetical protein F5890DRAFT_1531842, partial [Lentinula detonsa]
MVPGAVEIGEKLASKVRLFPGEDSCFLRPWRSAGKWKGETIVSSKNIEKSGLTKAKERSVEVGGDCSNSRSSLYSRSAIRKEGTEGLDTVGANSYTIVRRGDLTSRMRFVACPHQFDNERSGFYLAYTNADRRKHGRKMHFYNFTVSIVSQELE